jgi:regulator of replication initiation timing
MENMNIDSAVSQKPNSCRCGKSYKYKSGLMKHSEKCKLTVEAQLDPQEESPAMDPKEESPAMDPQEESPAMDPKEESPVIEAQLVTHDKSRVMDPKEKERLARRARLMRLDKLYNTLDEVTRLNSDLQFEKLGLQMQIQDLRMQLEDMHAINSEYKIKNEELRENVKANTNTKNTLRFHFPDKPISQNSMNHFTEQITRCLEAFYSKNRMDFPQVEY